jgi:spore coat polysaccharide biosynthesis protein SpsF
MKQKIVASIEARMTSSRLPGKVLLEAGGRPMLGHLVERLRRVPSVEKIVLATTTNAADEDLVSFAEDAGIACFRGDEGDVMRRVIGAAESVETDILVKFTGDCPIVDPAIVEQCVRMFLHNACDYVSNGHIPSYPVGMGVQVLRLETLVRSAEMTDDVADREHVTLHIRNHPELFRHLYLIAPADMQWPELRLTLDEQPDYRLIKQVIEYYAETNPWFGCRDVVELLRAKKDWVTDDNLKPTKSSRYQHLPIGGSG